MKLGLYLSKNDLAPSDFAALLGTTPETVRRYVKGTRLPSKKHMRSIVKVTRGKVKPDDFYQLGEM